MRLEVGHFVHVLVRCLCETRSALVAFWTFWILVPATTLAVNCQPRFTFEYKLVLIEAFALSTPFERIDNTYYWLSDTS